MLETKENPSLVYERKIGFGMIYGNFADRAIFLTKTIDGGFLYEDLNGSGSCFPIESSCIEPDLLREEEIIEFEFVKDQ